MKNVTYILLGIAFLFCSASYGQSLTCQDAEVLCSLNELDDFTGTMPSSNPNDEPAPFCNGSGNPQNMSWFAFIAGSESAVLELVTSNCNNGSTIQYGIYTDCSYSESIICQGSAVNADGTITLNLNGMVPGDDYFFFIDGDQGTYCDYGINVVSGGEPVPVPQPTGINCISANCPMDNQVCYSGDSYTFEVEGLDLTIDYLWYITPLPPGFPANPQTINGDNTITLNFPEAGDYQICMEATNGCTTTDQICISFLVFEADAGELTATPQTLCPGGTSEVTVVDYIESESTNELLIVVGPDGIILDVVDGDNVSVTYDECGTITVYSYNYIITDNPGVPVIGESYTEPNCNDFCCDVKSIEVVFEDDEEPTFFNPPADLTMDCNDNIPALEDITWNDNCDGTGSVMGTETSNYSTCDGGTIIRTWTYTDICSNVGTYTQTITLTAAPEPEFVDPPENITLSCDEIPTNFPSLDLSNNQSGDCLITGSVDAVTFGDPTICGGTIDVTWIFTDECNRVVSHVQTITIEPAEEPAFINPPENEILSCIETLPTAGDLDYTNNQAGDCSISGTITPSYSVDADLCGGTIVNTWIFTDECNRVISHVQTIIIEPLEEANFIDPPSDVTVSCNEILPAAPTLSYSNAANGSCEIMGTIVATTSGNSDICGGEIINIWEFTDQCDRVISHTQTITVEPAPEATYINPPTDITINCDEIPPNAPTLNYSNGAANNCEIMGVTTPIVVDNSNSCGGDISYTWEFTDLCNRTISHTQTITIQEAPIANFIDPPSDETISCETTIPTAPALSYTNNHSCSIMGSINPTINDNTNFCGGEIIYTWEFTDECNRTISHTKTITVEPPTIAAFTNVPDDTTIPCGDDAITPDDLDYTNNLTGNCEISGKVPAVQSGNYTACGGDILFTWEFTDLCNRVIQHVQTIIVEPASQAAFINPPADITVACSDFEPTPPTLAYTNGEADICAIAGEVNGTVIGTPNPCGVDVFYRWEFTDDCGRTITYNQKITIEEAPIASFINPPNDATLDCEDISTNIPTLNYSNNANGICEIVGNVSGIQSGFYDECGGNISYSWTFTDACNRTITHSQSIIVNPAPDPVFINLPNDFTLTCGEDVPTSPSLFYSNGQVGNCGIDGSVFATSNTIGLVTTFTWEYNLTCNNNTLIYSQIITSVLTPDISINPLETSLCIGSVFDLSTITITNATGNPVTITYLDQNNDVITNPIVEPTNNTIYTIVATNASGCTDEANFQIIVDSPPNAGEPSSGKICEFDDTYNLFDYLNGSYDLGGTWYDTDNSGANVDNPQAVDFSNIDAGIYQFTYVVFSTNTCPDVSTIIEIEIIQSLDIEILMVECAPNGASYTITVLSNGNTIVSTLGDVTVIDENNSSVSNIPAGQSVAITGFSLDGLCSTTIYVNAPDCDCPDVPSPTTGDPTIICDGDNIPELNVTTDPTYTTNWYDSQTSTTPITTMTNAYTPTVSGPGTYNYYVESEDAEGCVSLIRTLVQLIVLELPTVENITIEICDLDAGSPTITLSDYNTEINANANFIFTYYPSLSDAQDETNALDNIYLANSNTTIYVLVQNTAGCKSYAEVEIIINPLPSFNLTINNEICAGDKGSINIENISPSSTSFSLDNISFDIISNIQNLDPGNYTLYAKTTENCTLSEPFTILAGLQMTMEDLEIICNNNGTDSDSSDDYYTISFNLTNSSGLSDNIDITTATQNIGTYQFGEISFTVPTGNSQEITITHPITGCIINFNTGLLNPCSSNCSITITELTSVCDGNNTETDPSDDVYHITINATAVNGSTNNTFNVLVDGNIVANFEYSQGGTITIPAQGQTVTISILDNEDNQCFSTEIIGPLNPCSTDCILTIDNQNFICDNKGTIGIPTDDIYTFSFQILATNSNSNSFDLYVDATNVGTYNYGVLHNYEIPADGMTHQIEFIDTDNQTCKATITSPVLDPCSGMCSINGSIENIICFNEETANDESDDTFTAIIKINQAGGSGTWTIVETSQTGNSGQNITVGPFLISGGNISLEIIDSGVTGCSTTIEIIAPPPCSTCNETVSAGIDMVLDCDITAVILTGSSSTPGTPMWNGPGGIVEQAITITATIPGAYIFTTDFGDNCIKSDTAIVSVSNDIPIASAGDDQMITCKNETVELTGTVTGGSGQFTYQWLDANMNEISQDIMIFVTNPGNYFFVVYDIDTDCKSPASLVVVSDNSQNLTPQIHANPGNVLDCVIEVIYLTSDLEENTIYSWYINNILVVNDNQLVIYDASNIMLVAVDTVTGCEGMSELYISNLEEYPIISIISPQTLDCQNQEVTLDASQSQSGNHINYTWTNSDHEIIGTNVNTINIVEPGTYYLELVDVNNNCTNIDTITVTSEIDFPIIELDHNAIIGCDDVNINIDITVNQNPLDYEINWTTIGGNIISGQDQTSIVVDQVGSYIVEVENINTSCKTIDTILVELPPLIQNSNISVSDENCEENKDGTIQINSVVGGTPPYLYYLDGQIVNDDIITGLGSGTYLLSIIDNNGCSFETSIVIETSDPFLIDLNSEISVIAGETTTLTASINIPEENIANISWTPSNGLSCSTCLSTNLLVGDQDQQYTIRVTDNNGCYVEASINILSEELIIITVPNVFHPNSESNGNNFFTIYSNENEAIISELLIYDRWGGLMFIKSNIAINQPELGWDGTFKGTPVELGVFVYSATIKLPNGKIINKIGDITVIN